MHKESAVLIPQLTIASHIIQMLTNVLHAQRDNISLTVNFNVSNTLKYVSTVMMDLTPLLIYALNAHFQEETKIRLYIIICKMVNAKLEQY